MPVEIRELVIRTNVVDSNTPTSQGTSLAEEIAAIKAQIVAESVRETLGVLKKKEER